MKKVVVLSWGRDEGEEACPVTSLFRGKGLQCPRTCQGPESMLLYRSGLPMASSVFGLWVIRGSGLCKGFFWGEAGSATGGESQDGAGAGEGVAGPVSEERRRERKGGMVTRVCSMSADVFLGHTAVSLMKRSSSRPPCGLGLESPNLSAAPSTWQHEATPGFTSLLQLQGYTTLLLSVLLGYSYWIVIW